MPDYIIEVALQNVAEGDATSVAQDMVDHYGGELDYPKDMQVRVLGVNGSFRASVDWEPLTDA